MNKRIFSIVLALGLVVSGVLAGPATAAKKKKPKKPAACQPFTPGERGAEKPIVVVTDAAAEAAPVEQAVELELSLGDARLHSAIPKVGPLAESAAQFNVQVDSAAPDAGLYALIEFPQRRDYDLDVMHPDGSYAARSHDFNPIMGTGQGLNGGHAGEATPSSEKIVGLRTNDCGGWTIEVVNWLGEGGEITVKLWLGEAVHDPQAEGEEPHP